MLADSVANRITPMFVPEPTGVADAAYRGVLPQPTPTRPKIAVNAATIAAPGIIRPVSGRLLEVLEGQPDVLSRNAIRNHVRSPLPSLHPVQRNVVLSRVVSKAAIVVRESQLPRKSPKVDHEAIRVACVEQRCVRWCHVANTLSEYQ